MCLKGGPRCYTHANADYERTHQKLEKQVASNTTLIQQEHNARIRQEGYRGNDPKEIKALAKKRESLQKELSKGKERASLLREKDKKLFLASQATAGGINELERKIDDVESRGYGAEFLKGDLELAKKTYAHNLEKYDERNGTVDARKPSPYGSIEGIEALSDRLHEKEKKLAGLYKQSLVGEPDPALDKKIKDGNEGISRLKNQLKHAYRTESHCKYGIIPDPQKIAEAEAKAKKAQKDAQESWERSDTDGSMSQWASTTMAEHHRMEASLLRNGGKAEFNALFDKDGNMVPAKMVTVKDRYNPNRTNQAWAVLSDPDDVDSPVEKWVNLSNAKDTATREANLAKKGYTMGKVLAPAYVAERGDNLVNVRSVFARKDRGFSKNVEVVTKNLYPDLIREDEKRNAERQQQYLDQAQYKAEVDAKVKASKKEAK